MYGNLLLSDKHIILDIDCKESHARVLPKGGKAYIPVPYGLVSWVSPDWTFPGEEK